MNNTNKLSNLNKNNLEAVFGILPDAIILVNENGIIERINNAAAQLFNRYSSEILNLNICKVLDCINYFENTHECTNKAACSECPVVSMSQSVFDASNCDRNIQIQSKHSFNDKKNRWYEMKSTMIFIDESKYIILSVRDITAYKNYEMEKLSIQDVLEQNEDIAASAKNQFLRNINHEVRTPLNAIIGFSQILTGENITIEQKQYVNMILLSAKYLLELINDVLDYSNIISGMIKIEIDDCQLDRTITKLESLMRSKAREKGLDFQIIKSDKVPDIIRTDSNRLQQCLTNIINNAIKFTENGHIYVYISLEYIDSQPYIKFNVEDTGTGIPLEKQKKIFEEFEKFNSNNIRTYSGTGLGLPITNKLAFLLDGTLSISSKVDEGSIFSLTIPAGIDMKQDTSTKENNEAEAAHENKLSGHVLVVEDCKTNQMLNKILLEKIGLKVTIAQNGKEAVDKASEQNFNLVLMDIQMPVMDGFEATRILRERGLKIPIVALTAYSMPKDLNECIEAGCNDYMSKPVDKELLYSILKKYLQ